ncbi:MAG: hypothetical protein COC01_07830 [Bacteroidetes bacterium]|nr:hypothetical protein [Sphingobacteriaceae bacterium AH-315-L07]PCH66520.1 MAG: hypothetical protein COC01_07830 [Bacteroidota bacterium]
MNSKQFSRSILMVLFATLVIYSCKKDRFEEEEKDTYSSMDDFYNENKQEEQVFLIDSGDTAGPIIGKEGTKLYVGKDLFMYSSGADIDWPYTIKLIELYPIKDMLFYEQPTIGSGTILESAAEIRVRAFKGTDELVLKPGKAYYMELDSMASLETSMEVYYGFTNGSILDWSNDLTSINSSITTDSLSSVTTGTDFYTMTVAQMDWVDCAKAYSSSNPNTTIAFTAEGNGTEFIDIFISFKDVKSLMQVYSMTSGNIPTGTNVTVVAMAKNQDNAYVVHNEDIIMTSGRTIALDMQVTTESALLTILDGL